MAAVTKAELVENLFNVLGINKREAKEIIESTFEEIILSLEDGKEVKIAGFGNFKLRDKKQRPGRNPKTGKVVPVSQRRVVTFKVGQKLKKRIDENVATATTAEAK
jgi:integration host factor subunit alpha